MLKKILLVLFVFLSAVYLNAAEDFTAVVQSLVKDFMAATDAKDAARAASFYAEDAIVFPPNSEIVKGREAIQAFWKGMLETEGKLKLEIGEAYSEGSTGVEHGTFTIVGNDGKTIDRGKYVVVYKKTPAGWKIYRDIFNSSLPAAAAAPAQ